MAGWRRRNGICERWGNKGKRVEEEQKRKRLEDKQEASEDGRGHTGSRIKGSPSNRWEERMGQKKEKALRVCVCVSKRLEVFHVIQREKKSNTRRVAERGS